MVSFKIHLSVLLISLLLLPACSGKKNVPEEQSQAPAKQEIIIDVPDFNADTAYAYVAAQVAFGPRVPNTKAHGQCFHYLFGKLGAFCDTVLVQEATAKAWNGDVLNMKNIIGSFNPGAAHRILLAAHWDTRPYADNDEDIANHHIPIDGANDGGSGVGVLLEVARQIYQHPLPIGIDIIFFDAEDYGEPRDVSGIEDEFWCLGAQYWSENPHIPFYKAKYGILLDMVGVKNATFYMDGTSMYFAPDVMRYVWDMAHKAGYAAWFIKKDSPPIIDDHLYVNRNRGIPMIDIIHHDNNQSSGFFEHWHTIDDNLENIDKDALEAAGQTLLFVLYHEKRPNT